MQSVSAIFYLLQHLRQLVVQSLENALDWINHYVFSPGIAKFVSSTFLYWIVIDL